jgi:superfamily II DNA or RNA helicase
MESLLKVVRELAPPAVWSGGVELSRNSEVHEVPSTIEDERSFRIIQRPKDPVITVALSEVNEAWQSDCACEDDPCKHVIAAVLAVRQEKIVRGPVKRAGGSIGSVVHSFARAQGRLSFSRSLVWGDTRREVPGSLAAALKAIRPGDPTVAVSREEEQIDHVLPSQKSGVLDPRTMRMLLAALARLPHVELDGALVSVSSTPLPCSLEVVDDGKGFRVRFEADGEGAEVFQNGAALRGGTLCAVVDSGLTADEWGALRGEGRAFSYDERRELASAVIPALESRIPVTIKTERLPRAVRVAPKIVIETVGDALGGTLTAVPHLIYGEPPFAEVRGERIEIRHGDLVPVRDRVEESRLVRDLQTRLFLRLNEAKVLQGEAAINFTKLLKGWEVQGDGKALFTPAMGLQPRVVAENGGISLSFETGDGRRASSEAIASAWKQGGSFVRLDDGGWGELPKAWLAEHKAAALRLLAARDESDIASAQALADIEEVCDSLNVPCPTYFQTLRDALGNVERIADAPLPDDLHAELRSYQRTGVNWLAFLREHNLGALLADDMGLGKTLQAMCVMKGRTLVVAPTSVLYAWEEQLARFRPQLRVCRYHGPNRKLDLSADLVITTYALVRLDIEALEATQWDTIVLDESQTIKNPDSQVARATYRLRGAFKVNLSGTPVENSLEDLWSQFHFLNPGLLGNRKEFEESFAEKVRGGDAGAAQALRKRVAPFMLRRMKRDVALELPPKTEVVLECELDAQERVVYDGVLAASRSEVMANLAEEKDLLSVFEVLLRLRQACCHQALVPGHGGAPSSSKVRLLVESLRRSIDQGHRALVFSQWTSFLDLVEPALQEEGISWSRIDGSTVDRDGVMRGFQQPDGPSVLLLSLKAGGVGLNLTAADHVYILDPWWNPAVEDQAADRAYRIGQENPVIVHRLVARDTIEERVLSLQAQKRGLLAAAVGDSPGLGLTREDIVRLIAE